MTEWNGAMTRTTRTLIPHGSTLVRCTFPAAKIFHTLFLWDQEGEEEMEMDRLTIPLHPFRKGLTTHRWEILSSLKPGTTGRTL